jgi:hypothetical protein
MYPDRETLIERKMAISEQLDALLFSLNELKDKIARLELENDIINSLVRLERGDVHETD